MANHYEYTDLGDGRFEIFKPAATSRIVKASCIAEAIAEFERGPSNAPARLAEDAGYKAGYSGEKRRSPHRVGSTLNSAWLIGYDRGEKEKLKNYPPCPYCGCTKPYGYYEYGPEHGWPHCPNCKGV